MADIITLQNFARLLDRNLTKVLEDYLSPTKLVAPQLFGTDKTTRLGEEYWEVGSVPDIPKFDGRLQYISVSPGYYTKIETQEFAAGIMIERRLIDTKQFRVMNNLQNGLARSLARVKEKKAANILNYAFSAAWEFMSNEEGVALCAAHSTKSGVPTTTGFTNYGTSALSKTSLAAARVAMMKFKDDIGEFFDVTPDTLIVPVALYDTALEITGYDPRSGAESEKDPTTNYNTINVLYKQFKVIPWIYLDTVSTTNWFLADSRYLKQFIIWLDRIKKEPNTITDFETFSIKHSLYSSFGCGWINWRGLYGSIVS